MKFNFRVFIFLLFSVYSFCVFSQHDAKSKPILDALSNIVKTYTSYKTEFVYALDNKEQKVSESKVGVLTVKGGKYKVDFAGQEVFCDGKNLWIYIKDANEVQIKDIPIGEDAITPISIFTIWQKGFKSKFIKEELYNRITSQFIDLVPTKGKSYYKIRLIIDKAKKQVTSFTIYEKKGSTITYRVNKFTPNIQVNESIFTFNKANYPKVEEVDMR